MSKLGITKPKSSIDSNDVSKLVDLIIDFRNEVRARALARTEKDIDSLKACDNLRKSLSECGVDIRVNKFTLFLEAVVNF